MVSFPPKRLKRAGLLLLGATLAVAATVWLVRPRPRGNVLAELADARPARVFAPRLSIGGAYRPCTVLHARPGDTVPREGCGAAIDPPIDPDRLATAGESSDPDSLQARALLAMIASDEGDASLDTAIAALSRALPLSRRQVPILVDLSAAHLVRSERMQNPRDLLIAVQYAREALVTEPRNLPALFNAALALDVMGVDEQAALAWTAYLRADSTSRWATEARNRRRTLQQHPPTVTPPTAGAPAAEVQAFAVSHPQEARLLGWDSVLGRWGEAVEAGNTGQAAQWLQLAEQLGTTLEKRRGGDASLADAVRAIRATASDSAATHTLAGAHRAYAAGQALYARAELDSASDVFKRIARSRPPSPALIESAEMFYAARFVYAQKYDKAESAFASIVPRIDSNRYPALAARAIWMRSAGKLRNGDYTGARAPLATAAALFGRAGETEYEATTRGMVGEAAYGMRDTLAAYRSLHRALLSLRADRSSTWRHNSLFVLANCATIDGMALAALSIQDEDVAGTARQGNSRAAVEALLGRARMRSAARRPSEARRDVDSAQVLLAQLRAAPDPEQWFKATLAYSRALLGTDSAALAGLDSAIAVFAESGNPAWLLPALLRRAEIHLAQRDLPAAATDLDTATTRIRGLSQRLDQASLRAAVVEEARSRFDQLVMLHLDAGDTAGALQALERGRVSFAPGLPGAVSRPAARLLSPPGQVAVEYALIGDTLLTWTVRGSDVRLDRRRVDRAGLVTTIERVDAALESPARAASATTGLERLYDLLIRPVQARLGASETPLVILADGEIAGVPFPALLDSAAKRYLVEGHTLRFAATLADATRPAPQTEVSASHPALLVADPAFDRTQYASLDRLDGARAEVDAIRGVYRNYVEIAGRDATRAAFAANAPRAALIHYAGHALFDDARPERSALVLAGADTTGRLTAEAVNSLQLSGVRLVVLAACSTLRSREGRSGGFAGLSGSLLAAGAGGVVGSLWQVDDSLTQPLMLQFHRAYHRSGDRDPAAALRSAQRWMLHSRDPRLSSPAAWASFRYIGS